MNSAVDAIKRGVLRWNRLSQTLDRWKVITYQDRIRLRLPLYRRGVLFDQEGQDRIGEALAEDRPLLVARLGSVELAALHFYLEKRGGGQRSYGKRVRSTMQTNAGFFPATDEALDAFAEQYLEHLRQVDILGVWFNPYEETICNRFCANAELIEFGCLEPFHYRHPWSAQLAGRKVLVVHPFAESIRRQYAERRQVLFASPEVLPRFELQTLKAVQSHAGCRVDFPSWFEALRSMCDQMARVDFDVCLVGAGAYGLPLAAFAKSLGKQAIQLGGVTQILFGIKGRRWEEQYAETTAKLFNEHWVRPAPSETPQHNDRVEKGCYW